MPDTFSSVHPLGVEALPVVPRFPVPRVPDPPVRELNRRTVASYYTNRVVARIRVRGTDETVAIIDKAFPHSRFDIMLLVANDEVRGSCADLDDQTSGVVWALASSFREYIARPEISHRFQLAEAEVHQVFNYSRDTVDRENGQFYDKRFHLHMNCWPGSDLAGIEPVPLGSIADVYTRRRMLDPLAYLGPRIMRDRLGAEADGYKVMPVDVGFDIDRRLPPGLKVRLDGWHSLGEARFDRLLRRLHTSAEDAYKAIYTAVTGRPHVPSEWKREKLLDPAAIWESLGRIAWLGSDTRRLVHELVSRLRDVSEADMLLFRSDAVAAARHLTLAGLDYSIALCSSPSEKDRPFVVMQFRLLGDVGSASLPPLRDASMALLDRRNGPVLSETESLRRREFIEGFVNDAMPKLLAANRGYLL
ncbi:hypothetical protein [Catenulispora subtropica]|uniref:Uncharacterized protein n=1 Tax=Catenulispora subtropica TaxID=450798 RepID=A0ABN2SK75_9ACTN